jgi:conjugative relaxase-like TrwC/TraI family protein
VQTIALLMIMVASAGVGRCAVAVVVTAASGYDLGYVWRAATQGAERTAGGYYLNASLQGEAAGRWSGRGAVALGLSGEVGRTEYDAVYAQHDPSTGMQLGRGRGRYVTFGQHQERLLAAEPHATAERRLELEREAHRLAREPAPYTDVTVSFSKSISVLHASIRENARHARLAGDNAAAGAWEERDRTFQEVLQAANRAALGHAERWAGVVRTGYHGARVNGQETGRWETAALVVSSWLQGTSRDGDPQDHVHNQFARMARTDRDGKWRALDTMALRGQLPAMAAVAAAYVEAGLSRALGVAWVPRPDGKGREIRGVTQAQMDAYSTRTESIKDATPRRVAEWTARYGRVPNERELLHIQQQVTLATRARKDAGIIDWDALARRWDQTLGGELAAVYHDACAQTCPALGAAPTALGLAEAAQQGLAAVQASHATWTRAELMRHIGNAMPSSDPDPQAAVARLNDVTDRALASEFEQVVPMDAPEWPALPGYLRREIDGRSVYTRPGTPRYATRVQLSAEERLLAAARADGAPHLTREQAARTLGADADELDAALHTRAAHARQADTTGSGLRLDQAAALAYVLTSPQAVEVLVGPAGSGKTRTLAAAAVAWTSATGGAVIGTATSQQARNVLAAAGVELAENTSVLLGHLPGRRGARGMRAIAPGSLVVLDESSMTSIADMGDLAAAARTGGFKVVAAGDQEQLAAVEGGGGMSLLASELGYVQLAEAVRFTAAWEQQASLGLRAGQLSALDAYDNHGRITGGDPDETMEAARRAYVGHYLAGTDVLLIALERARCRELSRRIRDDLVHLKVVDASREVTLAKNARAGVGDIIICRSNDHQLPAAGPTRTLANGDVLRIEHIAADGTLSVRLRGDRNPGAGYQWAADTFNYRGYATADLAYAVTAHSAQGATVTVGLTLVTGAENRQWLYSAMTRGADCNQVFAFTRPRNPPEPQPGTRPAPELARHAQVQRERAGQPPDPRVPPARPDPRDALAVLADVLQRDGSQQSAISTRRQALANADHLAVLNAVWLGETSALTTRRYRACVAAALPAGHDPAELDTPHATWLWRTLRAAEAAGYDADDVVRQAVDARSLAGARSLAAVIDARIRRDLGPATPSPLRAWSEQVPECGGEKQRYLVQVAANMDDRKTRIGEFTAEHSPAWAVTALGRVPSHPLDRLVWEHRAANVGAYRELYGWDHDTEPIGPEPAGDTPEKRAAWHAAYTAMTRTDQARMSSYPDGTLHHMRATYAAETAWEPPHATAELRQVRAAILDLDTAIARSRAEAQVARCDGDLLRMARHDALLRSAQAAAAFYTHREQLDTELVEDRAEWEQITAGSRHLAVLADAELRRRHPGIKLEPLVSAEPEPLPDCIPAITETEATVLHGAEAAERRLAFREKFEQRLGVKVPAEDPDYEDEGDAWPTRQPADRDALLQPPKPTIRPAAAILQRQADTDIEHAQ